MLYFIISVLLIGTDDRTAVMETDMRFTNKHACERLLAGLTVRLERDPEIKKAYAVCTERTDV